MSCSISRGLLLSLGILALAGSGAGAAERVLDAFPVVVRCGLASETGAGALPDLPFSNERGYGYVGGRPDRLLEGSVSGGDPSWPRVWREGVESYHFRLPRGSYLVELTFLETDVALEGLRVFDVSAEGVPLFPALDIFQRAGDFRWLVRRGLVGVFDGWLELRFASKDPERRARISRIRIQPAEAEEALGPPPAPTLEAAGCAGGVVLDWRLERLDGVSGYGIFRAEDLQGSFQALGTEPVSIERFRDAEAIPGKTYHYRVVAFDVWGRQGPVSGVVSAAARGVGSLGLKTYELHVAADELRRLSARGSSEVEAPAELRYLGASHWVQLRVDTSREGWQAKKSYLVSVDLARSRSFGRRRAFFLSAAAGDGTRLRETLSRDVEALLGLAGPAVEPVALVLNGRFQGLYFDTECLDRSFRRRAGLDRVGLFTERTRPDFLLPDWRPHGVQIGEGGTLSALGDLVHELNRLDEGEMPRFFEESFYLDRLISRWAFLAARGEDRRSRLLRFALRDSRNGRWELLERRAGMGSSGMADSAWSSWPPATGDARRVVFGESPLAGGSGMGEWSVLESRFLGVRELRERYLKRLEEILSKELSPEALESTVDAVHRRLREGAIDDAILWPQSGGREAVLSGPTRILEAHRSRTTALLDVIREASGMTAGSLEIEGVLDSVEGKSGARIVIRNPSASAVKLSGYRLVNDAWALARGTPGTPGGHPLGEGTLAARGRETVDCPPGFVSASGGFLAILGSGAEGVDRRGVEDFLFYGRRTRGLWYRRFDRADLAWGSSVSPPGASDSDARVLAAPSWGFRQGLRAGADGAMTVWFRSTRLDRDPRAAEVRLLLEGETPGIYEAREMPWTEESLGYSIALEPTNPARRRPYYFLAVSADGVERAFPLAGPEPAFAIPVLPPVRLNEVLPRPSRMAGRPGEFIELFNPGDVPVELEGYFLTDTRRNPTRWRIPAGVTIGAKGFVVFQADGRDEGLHTSFKLANSGEFVGLFGRLEEGNLLVDGLAYRGMRTGESWGASPDGTKNHRSWKDPTPGARNLPKIPAGYLEAKAKEREAESGSQEAPEEGAPPPLLPEPDEEEEDWDREVEDEGP